MRRNYDYLLYIITVAYFSTNMFYWVDYILFIMEYQINRIFNHQFICFHLAFTL